MTVAEIVKVPQLYHSPQGLYEFQINGVAYCYERIDNLAVWDTGIGKSHLAMATGAMLTEDDAIDVMLIVAEKNKIRPDEWPHDLATFTNLTVGLYHGDIKRRAKVLAEWPQVLLSTYETIRNDAIRLVEVEGRKSKKMVRGPLLDALAGKRVALVYDEMTKLGNRSSGLHKAHDFMVRELRKSGSLRVLGLTATPIERSPENIYNLGRIFMPGHMPTVAQFERDYVKYRDIYGNARRFKNLTSDTLIDSDVVPFVNFIKPIMLRKRKTDQDVIEQFPQTQEDFHYVELSDRQQDFYEAVVEAVGDVPGSIMLMRQIVGHPMSIIRSDAKLSKAIVDKLGVEMLESLGSTKTDDLVEYLKPLVLGQGAQVVVFTFFASVIPYLQAALEGEGMTVSLNHGSMPDKQRDQDKALFRAGERDVFLTSDAGARGINLPEAMYVVEYEMALTHANRTQRLNRIHRIDSKHPNVTFMSFITRDTIEEGFARMTMERNEWSDLLLDDDDPGEHFISAADRKRLLAIARKRKAV